MGLSSVVIRLRKRGKKGFRLFDVVVTNRRSSRDGACIEKLGTYNPMAKEPVLCIKKDSVMKWLDCGASTSDAVRPIFSKAGIWLERHLDQCCKKGKVVDSGDGGNSEVKKSNVMTEERKKSLLAEWREKKNASPKRKMHVNFIHKKS